MLPQTGGHLYSIHDQKDYDKLHLAVAGYTKPVMIGLHSDSAGNWEWTDGSPVDLTFLQAHSYDGLSGAAPARHRNVSGRVLIGLFDLQARTKAKP